jgi:hypothetical protein
MAVVMMTSEFAAFHHDREVLSFDMRRWGR